MEYGSLFMEKVQSVPKKVRIVPNGLLSFANVMYFFRKREKEVDRK